MNRILVTGANGQLGSEIQALAKESGYTYLFTDREELDICNAQKVAEFLDINGIEIIINCAAYTAVDKAESEQEAAYKINAEAPKNLATESKKRGIVLIHVSTDYVFDGTSCVPYKESDTPNPIGIYGKSKLAGEEAIREIGCKGAIIRTSWLYSSYGANFVKTMLRLGAEREKLGVVFDQIGTPTYARDLAKTILGNIETFAAKEGEVYHFANEGVCSWYDFAKAIMQTAGLPCKINPIESFEYPTPAKRPHFSVFNKAKIKKELGIEIAYWKDALNECLIQAGVKE